MEEYLRLLRALNKLEEALQAELLTIINELRLQLIDFSDSPDQLKNASIVAIQGAKIAVSRIANSYITTVTQLAAPFLSIQSVEISISGSRFQTFVDSVVRWLDTLLGMILQAADNPNVDLHRAVFPTRITQDDASAFRLGTNSMKLHTQLAIFTLANGVILDSYINEQDSTNARLSKIAVSKIDDRTTKTCVNINGQAVPVTGKFELTHRPRFARLMDMPPFHHNCRTSALIVRSKNQLSRLQEEITANV